MKRTKSLLSPLRYPGSKRRLASYIMEVLRANSLTPALYVEPFVGGASVALQLMHEDLVDKVILIDQDPWITSFWQTVFFDTAWLVEQIQNTDVTLEHWKELKARNPKTTREQAWTCFYLNRTSFSGILEPRAGPLGGMTQTSKYKIDCRFPKASLIERIEAIASHRDKIHAIWNCSWDVGMAHIREQQGDGLLPKTGVFFYFDPPFFEKAESLYRFYFTPEDHNKLRDCLLNLEDRWLLSYDSAKQVDELYGEAIRHRTNGANRHHIEICYSAAGMSQRRRGKEVILSNLPILPHPATIGAEAVEENGTRGTK